VVAAFLTALTARDASSSVRDVEVV
jgi:hypothetical protein